MFGKLTQLGGDFLEKQVEKHLNLGDGGGQEGKTAVERVEKASVMTPITGKRRALFVGINYPGTKAELRGCINDVKNISKWLFSSCGFDLANSRILTDDTTDSTKQPTRANIIEGMKWLVSDAKEGDSLFFHYSGHGGTTKDLDGDEVDGQDETICPVDYTTAGVILDDVMHSLLVKPLPKGCHLTCIYDSCHSGSALDLPYTYTIDGNLEIHVRDNTKAIIKAAISAGMSYAAGDKTRAMASLKEGFSLFQQGGFGGKDGNKAEMEAAKEKMRREKGTTADVVQLSGCKDEQTSADACIEGAHTGAMSHAFIETMKSKPNLTYADLLKGLRGILAGKYSQVPQLR